MSEPLIPVPGRLHSVATEGHLAGADEIIDDNLGEVQSVINARYDQKLDLIINDIDQSREMILDKLDDIEELDHYHVASYIIDQTNSIGLPSTFVRKTTASKDAIKTIEIEGETVYVDTIKRIWANTKLYVGLFDSTNNILKCKEVSREDKTLYADGTQVSITLSDEYDMFMKLPSFYWRCVETDTNIYHVEFSMSEDYVDNTWHYWDGDTFIGVYEGVIRNNKLYSKPGVTPTLNVSWTDFKAASRAKANNNLYTLISYEAHKIMALLGYGWLNTTDAQSIIGYGTSSYPKITGLCDSLGIVDGMNQSINFWGIENWWGDIAEWIDNIQTANTTGLINILDKAGNVNRTVQAHCTLSSGHCISKMELGSQGDLIAKELTNDDYNRAYADSNFIYDSAGVVANRSDFATNLGGGLTYLSLFYSPSSTSDIAGSRLQYKGDYTIVENF